MSSPVTYDTVVAARTRAADEILATPDLLAAYEARGGLADDLRGISGAGHRAEVLSQTQSSAQAAGGASTEDLLTAFTALQKEYGAVMAVVQAVRLDLIKAQAPADVVKAIEKILVNEAEVLIKPVKGADGKPVVGKDGKPKKAAVKSLSQEALRAEIARDARGLLDLSGAHAALDKRKVDKARLTALLDAAGGLSGKLADRTSTKGGGKTVTTNLHDAVIEQKQLWAACYRILAALGRADTRAASLLTEAASERPAKKKSK
jgi:hypothetical protein